MQHIGPLSLFLFWLTLLFVFKKWGLHIHRTLSDHVKNGASRTVYMSSSYVTMTALSVFMLTWLLPHVRSSRVTYFFVIVSYVSILCVATIPRTQSKKHLHDMCAALMGSSLFLILLTIATLSSATDSLKWVVGIACVPMCIIGVSALQYDRKYYLLYQGAYYLIFTIMIILLTYSS